MKTGAVALTAFFCMLVWYCGSSEPRYVKAPQPTSAPGICSAGEVKQEACAGGEEGAIVKICSSSLQWEIASNSCSIPGCSETTFEAVQPIIKEDCVQCHQGYDQYATAKAKINNFINRVNLPSTDVRSMPRGKQLNQAEKDTFNKWKTDGLKERCSTNPQYGGVTLDSIETAILEDLTRIDPFSRSFIRYFVVKDGFRAGINKGVNSVSLSNEVLNPEEVDARLGLYRIDLEEYDLTRNDWRVIESFDDIDFESFSSKGLLIKGLTNARKPWLHGRNFTFISEKTPIYYFLLGIPKTIAEFQRLDFIDISFKDEFARLKPRLMGFNGSPISLNKNRLIGRFETQEGYLWATWDVLNVADRGKNLFEEPLIADAGGDANFRFDGSELIFTLPNGLQGYALFDGAGNRVDAAPVNLVFDTESPFDPEIANGIDCHRCHARGLLAAEDQIRSHVERNAGQFGARDVQLVQFLFPRNELPLFNIDNTDFKEELDIIGQAEIDSINETTDYLRNDYTVKKTSELLFVSESQLLGCINASGVLQAQIGQFLTGGTVTFGALTAVLPTLFRECGFNNELFYP